MRIDLTREQYTLLAELVYLGNWVVNGHRLPDELIEKYDGAEQLFLSFSKRMVNYGLIKYYDEDDTYGPALEMERRLREFIKEYDEATLWEELSDRLAARDLREQGQEITFEGMLPLADRYDEEFSKNHLDNVRVDWNQTQKR